MKLDKIQVVQHLLLLFTMVIVFFLLHNLSIDKTILSTGKLLFLVWTLLPYPLISLFFMIVNRVTKKERRKASQRVRMFLTAIVLLFTFLGYSSIGSTSTGALVVIFIPLYIIFGVPLLYWLLLFLSRSRN